MTLATSAEQKRRCSLQGQAYLGVMQLLVDCRDAYIVSTRPETGTRESGHVVAHYRLRRNEILRYREFES
jgi:hypothetical protein